MADETSVSKKNASEKSTFYREALLEHAKRPKYRGRLAAPHFTASASNPLCGDELELTLRLAEGNIEELGFAVRGCTIVQAAASMISEAIAGMPLEAALRLGAQFREAMETPREAMEAPREALETPRKGMEAPHDVMEAPHDVMEGRREVLPEGLEPLQPLTAVKQHRSRIRCALLPWDALDACGTRSKDG